MNPLARLLHPRRTRLTRCQAAGTHRPVLIDLGRSKMCPNCGEW